MSVFSYTIVADGMVMSGTDYTGAHDSAEQVAVWYRNTMPEATQVSVWAGESDDRPAHLEMLVGVA